MPPKKRKNSNNELDNLKWALRKRGIRPTGTQQNMAKKLESLKVEEERVRNMNNNSNKTTKTRRGSGETSVAEPHHENNVGLRHRHESGPKVRHRSGSIATEVEERVQIVLWRRPFKTLYYFCREIPCALADAWKKFMYSFYDPKKRSIPNSRRLMFLLVTLGIVYGLHFIVCKEDAESIKIKEQMYWYGYWVFLGILSSVGLGTGLHTFVLYLGPFIAKVTLAAQECGTVDFPKPPYPDQVLCPDVGSTGLVTVADILGKVRWESLMWGFGTALGELPPYFMARAARVSGMADDEDLEKFTELLQRKKRMDPSKLGLLERGKVWMEDLVEKVGFWGILACASIPNPLFDLAGITCGHFLVPFTTFFGATVIGKAIIKAHLQMTFVILAFNQELLDRVVDLIRSVPKYGPMISEPFVEFINHQKANLHHKTTSSEQGKIAFVLEKFVMAMVIYFVISIVNSMAQSYHKRISKEKKLKS